MTTASTNARRYEHFLLRRRLDLILLFVLIALWNFGGVLLGVIVAIGRVFGAWQDQPFDAKWLWAVHGVRFTESVIYLGLAARPYRVVWTS